MILKSTSIMKLPLSVTTGPILATPILKLGTPPNFFISFIIGMQAPGKISSGTPFFHFSPRYVDFFLKSAIIINFLE